MGRVETIEMPNGYKKYKEYDDNNNLVYAKFSSGYELYKEYDNKNRVVYSKNPFSEYWYKYLEDGTYILRTKFIDGRYEAYTHYDKNGTIIDDTHKSKIKIYFNKFKKLFKSWRK
jgi:hypothetical protein